MSSKLGTILCLNVEEQEELEKAGGKLKSLADWLAETVEATKDMQLYKMLGDVAEAAKEWSGAVKAIGKLIDKLTKERSPEVLGWLACNIAYRQAIAKSVALYGPPSSHLPFSKQVVAAEIRGLRLEDPSIIRGFSLKSSAAHPFLRAADDACSLVLEAAGYDPVERRNLLRSVRPTFKAEMQELLSGEHKEKFAPFVQWLELDTDDQRLQETLMAYAESQRAEFEDQPALGIEPFAIADVYIESECGLLDWKTIRDEQEPGKRIDPFSEESAPRQDLLGAVLALMGRKKFNDCIVIQGAPGAGKSTFTRKLCVRLIREGLIPIRIPLQYLRVDANLYDAIQDVVVRFSGSQGGAFRRDLLPEKVLSEKVTFSETEISPYVFIFDGWDEISLSAAEGFQQRIERLLDSIRQTFLAQNRNKVRVVLTGRPSQAVGRTNFLRDSTPVLTIRSIHPEHLERYLHGLSSALQKPAFKGDDIDMWSVGDLPRYAKVIEEYKSEFPHVEALEVLGQPLLAHLAIKVMASFKGDLSDLITPSTTLYRHLVDLTCLKGGKHPADTTEGGKSARIEGNDLRSLLHGTALAITAHGSESIPMDELELRLETLGVGKEVFQITKQHPLTNLMISFYFKGVHEDAGCEFLHKSFREYLTAEAIVEVLKQYSNFAKDDLPQRSEEAYWRDFQSGDPRYWLSRKLGEMLSAQSLSREISGHISELLKWELQRASEIPDNKKVLKTSGKSTTQISTAAWERVRDGLADLWDWWGEGVHLRPQPIEKQRIWKFDDPPYVVELVTLAMRRFNAKRVNPPRPPRTATVDAHLGSAIFQLCCFVHFYVSERNGWLDLARELGPAALWERTCKGPRRYQVTVVQKGIKFVQFTPSGDSPYYFRNYVCRINGAGVQAEHFPRHMFMAAIDLSDAQLLLVEFTASDLRSCNFGRAELAGAVFETANVGLCLFANARLYASHMLLARADGADFTKATLSCADIRLTEGGPLNFSQHQLDSAALGNPRIVGAAQSVPEHWGKLDQLSRQQI